MSNRVKVIFITVVAVVIAGIGWFSFRNAKPAGDSVAIREIQSTAPTQWELAKKLSGRDILAEEGVRVEVINGIQSGGGTVILQALLANNIDTGGSAWPAWINIIARGGKIKALLGVLVSTKDNECSKQGLLVLDDSTIHTIKDLVGKRIAVNVLGAEADYVIRLYLKKHGLSISQVELVVVPVAQQEQMLRNRQVDAVSFGTIGVPEFGMTVANGGVRQIPGTTNFETKGAAVLGPIGFRNDFIEKHPDTVRRYLRAYDVARRIIYNEFQKNPERVRKAYADMSVEKGSNPDFARFYQATAWTPDFPFIVDKDVQWWIDRFIEDGLLKPGQIKPSDIYTNEFNPLYKKQ